MPKYRYIQFQVMCFDLAYFRLDQMPAAVEYLSQQPQTGFTGLIALVNVIEVRFKLFSSAYAAVQGYARLDTSAGMGHVRCGR